MGRVQTLSALWSRRTRVSTLHTPEASEDESKHAGHPRSLYTGHGAAADRGRASGAVG